MTNKIFSIIRNKPDRCDIAIISNPELKDDKSLKLSLRTSIDEWLESFKRCVGCIPQQFNQKDMNDSTESESESEMLNLSLDLSQIDKKIELEQSSDKTNSSLDENLKWDLEISKQLRKPPPERSSCFTESVHLFLPLDNSWVKRMIKLDSGIINIYNAIDNTIVLQGIVYLAGCTITPLNQSQQPITEEQLQNHENSSVTLLRITQTRENFSILSKYGPAGNELCDYFDGSSIDIQFLSPSILKSSINTIKRAIELNVVPLESLIPLTEQQRDAMYFCDFDILSSNSSVDISQLDTPINIILHRYFKDLQKSENFQTRAYNFIAKQVNSAYRPDFIVRINLLKYLFFNLFILFLGSFYN